MYSVSIDVSYFGSTITYKASGVSDSAVELVMLILSNVTSLLLGAILI